METERPSSSDKRPLTVGVRPFHLDFETGGDFQLYREPSEEQRAESIQILKTRTRGSADYCGPLKKRRIDTSTVIEEQQPTPELNMCRAGGGHRTWTSDEEDPLLYASGEEEEGEYEVGNAEDVLLIPSDEGQGGEYISNDDDLKSDHENISCGSMISDEEENLCFLEDIDMPYCFTFTPPRPQSAGTVLPSSSMKRNREESEAEQESVKRPRTYREEKFAASSPTPSDLYDFTDNIAAFDPFALDDDSRSPATTSGFGTSMKRNREESEAEQVSVKRPRTYREEKFMASSPAPLDLYDVTNHIAAFDPFAPDNDSGSPATTSGPGTSMKRNREESETGQISRKRQRTSFEETFKVSSPAPSDLDNFDDDIAASDPFALDHDSD